MHLRIDHNINYLNCGVLCLHHYQEYYSDYYAPFEVSKKMFKEYCREDGNLGARLVQGGFAVTEDDSKKVYQEMVALWGEPAYKSPERINANSKKKFFTAIWDLADQIDSKGNLIKEKTTCAA